MKGSNFYEKIVFSALERLKVGSLAVITPSGERYTFTGEQAGENAEVQLNTTKALKALVLHGDNGWAESYMRGEWEADDLAAFMSLVCKNVHVLEQFFHGKKFSRMLFAFMHRLRPNTLEGSRKNIMAHYDLGNEFYRLWLDESMTYSSALFKADDESLASAQANKYDRIITKLAQPGDVLEIGCGWGGFAERASANGFRVTGLTLSPAQAEFAIERLSKKGLAAKTDIQLTDYRKAGGLFDYVVSIEMFEAVGERYWPQYFDAIKQRLKQDGRAVIQTITIDEDVFEGYRLRGDFIQRYVFPGGMLPSHAAFEAQAAKAGLKVQESFAFGLDYARTLSEWLVRFDEKIDAVRALGYPPEFIRKWRFYLAYCIGGFASKRTDVVQYELVHV